MEALACRSRMCSSSSAPSLFGIPLILFVAVFVFPFARSTASVTSFPFASSARNVS